MQCILKQLSNIMKDLNMIWKIKLIYEIIWIISYSVLGINIYVNQCFIYILYNLKVVNPWHHTALKYNMHKAVITGSFLVWSDSTFFKVYSVLQLNHKLQLLNNKIS